MALLPIIETPDPRFRSADGLLPVTFKSDAIRGRADVTLFVPSAARQMNDVPLVLLLHGVYGSHWAWSLSGGAHQTATRMIESGEIPMRDGRRRETRLGHAQESDPAVVAQLPEAAQKLIHASSDLYARVHRIDEGNVETEIPQSPARALMGRLERGLGGGGA